MRKQKRKLKSSSKSLQTFYILIATQVFSLIGSQMTSLAIGIWVYEETGNATPLALAAFFGVLPQLAMAGFAGVLADRWDRRYVMVLADAGQAVGTLLLMISFLSGSFQVWHLYVITAFSAAFGVFQGPAFSASVTMLIPDDQRDRANAIRQLTGPMAGIFAPMLAGLLFALIDAPGVMLIDLITFVVAITVVWLVRIPRPVQTAEGRAAQGSMWHEAWVGFSYLWERRPLFILLLAATAVNFFFGITLVALTPYVLSLTGSEATLGALMSAMSAGAIVGGLIMSVWGGTRPRVHTTLPGIMVSGVFFVLFGIVREPVLLGIILAGMMLPLPMVNAAFSSILQIKTPPDMQGRVFAAVGQIAMLMTPLAYLLAGPLVDHVFEASVAGAGWSLVEPLVGAQAGSGIGLMAVISGCMIFLSCAAFYALPGVRHLEANLPDYAAVAAEEPATVEETAPEAGTGTTTGVAAPAGAKLLDK